jgi:HEAT repeat protein
MKRRTFLATSFGSILALQNGGTLAQQAPTRKQILIQNCIRLLGKCEFRLTCFSRYEIPEAARDILSAIGEPATSALCDVLLQDKEIWRRGLASEALIETKDPAAIPALLKALQTEEVLFIRAQVAEALGNRKANVAVEPLIETLHVRDKKEIAPATLAGSAAVALGKIGDARAIEPLLRQIGNEEFARYGTAPSEYMWQLVTKGLVAFGQIVVPQLIGIWGTQGEAGRTAILQVLGELKGVQATTFLYRELRRAKTELERLQCAMALARCGDRRATRYLLPLLKPSDESYLVARYQYEALEAMVLLKDMTTLKPLLNLVRQTPNSVAAIRALGALESREVAAQLHEIAATKSGNYECIVAVEVLGERKERGALPLLKKILEEDSKGAKALHYTATTAIGRMEPEFITTHLRSAKDPLLTKCISAAGNLRMSSTAPLIYEYARSYDEGIRYSALSTLGKIAPASYIARLEPLLYQKAILEAGYAAQAIVAIRKRHQT